MTRVKIIAIIFFVMPFLALAIFRTPPNVIAASATVEDPAAVYKAKCLMCHTATAAKFFDPAKPEADHVQVILKGKKGEKPPFMPGYEAKGMTEDEAKALVTHMKSLKTN